MSFAPIKQIENILFKLLSGTLCVFAVSWVMYVVWCHLSTLHPPGQILPIFNMRDGFYIIMFLGLPFGSTLGITVVNKLFGTKPLWCKGRLALTFVGGIVGPVLILWVLPWCGLDVAKLLPQFKTYGYDVDLVIVPFTSAIMALVGDLLWLPIISIWKDIR